jgi:hypothetical protein
LDGYANLSDFKRLLAIKRYSTATIKTYLGQLTSFQEFVMKDRPIKQLNSPTPLTQAYQPQLVQGRHAKGAVRPDWIVRNGFSGMDWTKTRRL